MLKSSVLTEANGQAAPEKPYALLKDPVTGAEITNGLRATVVKLQTQRVKAAAEREARAGLKGTTSSGQN